MAHHIAELLSAVDNAPNAKLKQERGKEAFETINNLWTHRSKYENRINPLFELKPIIQVMSTLDPARNVYVLRNEGTGYVYDIFRRLMICLLFRKVESISRVSGAVSRAKATSRFQSNEERSVIAALDFWLEGALTRESAKLRKGPPKTSKVEKLDLNKVARELIVEARKALDEVEQEIVEGRASKRKSAP